jgi:Pyridoxamine 5'-phosphate oxidase
VSEPTRRRDNKNMGKTYEVIDHGLAEWLEAQPVFFVSTAPLSTDGLVNCSPKGNRDEFVVIDERVVAYLDQTGSGVETIAHLRENGRIVVMFCAFVGAPRIVRLHGRGRAVLRDDPSFPDLAHRFPGGMGVGVRSIIVTEVSRIADSCGYGVPFMSFECHRPTMDQWSNRKGPDGIRNYWAEKNAKSIDQLDGFTTHSALSFGRTDQQTD